MNKAVIATLQALLAGKEVTALNSGKYYSTRITNEISTLRNKLGVDIITERIVTKNNRWYGSYRLVKTTDNLKKAKKILSSHSNKKPTKTGYV